MDAKAGLVVPPQPEPMQQRNVHGGAGAVLIFPSNFNQSLTDSISVAATVLFQMCLLAVPTFGETPTRSSDDVLALGANVRGAIPRWSQLHLLA